MPNADHVDSKDFLKEMTDEQRQQWARAIVQRMLRAWGIEEYKALAEILGVHSQTPSNWIQKRSVPWSAVYTCHKQTGRSLDWLYDGEKPRTEITPPLTKTFEKSALELLNCCEKMGLVKQGKAGGFDSVAEGMANSLIEILEKE